MIRSTPRLWQIFRVFSRYGLREFLNDKPSSDPRPRGERLKLFGVVAEKARDGR